MSRLVAIVGTLGVLVYVARGDWVGALLILLVTLPTFAGVRAAERGLEGDNECWACGARGIERVGLCGSCANAWRPRPR